MTQPAAITAMRAAAPTVAADPAWQPPVLLRGERIVAYDGANTAQIAEPGSEIQTLMQSSWPLVATDSTGHLAPTDMTLTAQTGGGWEPKNSPLSTEIGATLAEGVHLGGADGIDVQPGGDASTAGDVVGNKVFYANSGTDTDTIVDPTPTGVQFAWTLRSPSSPEDLVLDNDLPVGASLVAQGPGIAIVSGGRVVGSIAPPTATDAQGTAVPVSYRLEGDVIHVEVPHRERDLAYPISVDPLYEYEDSNGNTSWTIADYNTDNGGVNRSGFVQYAMDRPENFNFQNDGTNYKLYGYPNRSYGSAAWILQSWGQSFITRADFAGVGHDSANTCLDTGLLNFGSSNPTGETGYGAYYYGGAFQASAPQIFTNCGTMPSVYVVTCVSSGCDSNWGTPGNVAGMQMRIIGTTNGLAQGWFQGAYTFRSDRDVPTISSIGGLSSGWSGVANTTITATVGDAGLGVGNNGQALPILTVTPDGQPSVDAVNVPYCDGGVAAYCPSSMNVAVPVHLRDGSYNLHFSAHDVINHETNGDRQVYIDTRAPTITTSGRLADLGRSTSGSEPSRSVSKPVHLTVVVSDHADWQTSGVGRVMFRAQQGSHYDIVTAHAVQSDGSWKIDYDFVPSNWDPGVVHFNVTASDAAGNTTIVDATNRFDVNVARGDLTSLIEGQRSARRLILQAKDLNPASPATSVHFQYRTRTTDWNDIPANKLQAMDGSAVSTNSFAMSSTTHLSPRVVYNVVDHLPSETGPIYVRGWFSGTPGDTTDDVLTGIDTSGLSTSDSRVDIGPGAVDELTGNFQLADNDVSIDSFKEDLGVSRTYNSLGSVSDAISPFGPGWTLGTQVKADASIYRSVVDYDQYDDGSPDDRYLGVAGVYTSAGGMLPFEEHEADDGYYAEPEHDNLRLTRQVGNDGLATSFTLKDVDTGETMIFDRPGKPGEFSLGSVQQAASSAHTTFTYTPVSGGLRLTGIVAPIAAGVDCSVLSNTGCRSLRLAWDDTRRRVVGVYFNAPGNGFGGEVQVAAYEYDANGRLSAEYDPRISPYLKTQYTYDANGHLASVTPPGENAWTLRYRKLGSELDTVARLNSVSRAQPTGGTSQTATQTVVYGVAVSGSGAPNDMSANALAAWSQIDDIPTDAAALFRPDDVPADTPASYAKATVHYLDALGRMTNEVRPGGEVDTTEHDAAGDVVRALSAANRATALATGTTAAAHASRASDLSTLRVFGERTLGSGWRLLDEQGPLHSTRLANGTTVQGRRRVQNTYNDNLDPDSKALNLPVTTVESAYIPGTGNTDSRTTAMTYDDRTGNTLTTTIDPSGLNLTTKTEYNSDGLVTDQEQPRSNSTTAASTRHTIYYTAGTNSEDNPNDPIKCGNRPAWANLPCKAKGGGATTGTLPSLPVSVFEYDGYEHQTKQMDQVGGTTVRTQVDGYSGDRHASQRVTGTTGDARPDVAYTYSSTTGRLLTTAGSSPAEVVTRGYNAAGQISSYTDADGGTTDTAYELDGRPTTIRDPSGTRTITYDPTTSRISSITEPQLGAITTAWNADGDLMSEVFPNANVKLTISHDETGTVTGRSYVDQSPCSSNCTIYSDSATRSAHDQWLTEVGTDKTRTFTYDAAGRLTSSSDAPGGTACVTKTYTYDADGDRLTRRTYPAGTGGACTTSTTPTTQTLTYDEADRLNNTGYAYDTLGRITTVPAADAGGTNALTNTYYVDDRAHTMSQGGTTTTLDLDPHSRVRQRTVGAGTPTVSHYGDDSDNPVWTTQGSTTLRNSEDANGDQIATVSSGGSGTWTGPTTSVLDNFNRADGALGANWSVLSGKSAVSISANQAAPGTSGSFDWWNAASFSGEGEVYMTVPTASTATGNQLYLDIGAGWSTTSTTSRTGYELSVTRQATNDTFQVARYVAGTKTGLGGAQAMTGHVGAGDKVALTREAGGKLKMWLLTSGSSTWTQIGPTVTDATYFDSGQAWQPGLGSSGNAYRFDDFGGGQITPNSPSTTKLEISDLHGDVVSEVANTTNATTSPLNTTLDAFGAPTSANGAHVGLGYLGAKRRNTALSSGTVEMGARLYQPQIGRFLQTDPVFGGSCNTYDYVCQDPANVLDLGGTMYGPEYGCGGPLCPQDNNRAPDVPAPRAKRNNTKSAPCTTMSCRIADHACLVGGAPGFLAWVRFGVRAGSLYGWACTAWGVRQADG